MSSWSLKGVEINLQLKQSGPVASENAFLNSEKFITPLINIGGGKSFFFCVCAEERRDP